MAAPASSSLAGEVPIPRTRLIGRDAERAAARASLLEENVALLTLTGPGGVGKTRLALAIAQDVATRFADGIAWVDLSPLRDPALLPGTVSAALGLAPSAGSSLEEQLAGHLGARQTLLLLDNCEHVLEETAELVGYLLPRSPAMQVLATSRAPLRVRGEQVLPVDPLPVPTSAMPSLEEGARNEAIRLFVERAHAVRPGFALTESNTPTVAALCRQLDGLPLAIELAAARISMLTPEALLAQLSHRLQLLGGGPRDLPPRQQTMAATIAWSYELLTPDAQDLLRRLSVFVGGFTREAVQRVATRKARGPLEIEASLATLVDQSLVRWADGDDTSRFTMLETIREYAWGQLMASVEKTSARDAHAAYFLALAEESMPYLTSAADPVWLDRLEAEHDNLLAALGWLADSGDVAGTVRLAGALGWFWYYHGHFQEGRAWLERALTMDADNAAGAAPASARADVLVGLGVLLHTLGEGERAVALLGAGAALRRAEGDDLGRAYAESLRGGALVSLGRYDEAETIFEAVLPFYTGHVMAGHALFHLGLVAYTRDDRERTRALCQEAVELFDAGQSRLDAIEPLHYLGLNACAAGDLLAAAVFFAETLVRLRVRRSRVDFANGFVDVATLAVARGDHEVAARLFGAADAIRREDGAPFPLPARIAYERAADRARVQLGDEAWSAAYAVGEALSLDRALLEAETVVMTDAASPAAVATSQDLQTQPSAPEAAAAMLTRRERDVLALLCHRLTDPEIAEALFLSPRTASNHVANILAKLGAPNRREAAALAARHGLL
jgi:non-specific serine/threonine protein kinase